MPKIQDYSTPQYNAATNAIESETRLAAPGAVGRSIQQFGEGVSSYADQVYKRKAQEEISNFGAQFAELKANQAVLLDDEIRAGTINATDAQERLRKQVEKLGENIETAEGRNYFERQSGMLSAFVTQNASRGEALVAGEKIVTNLKSTADKYSNLMGVRPNDFNVALDDMFDQIDSQASLGEISVKQAADLKKWSGEQLSYFSVRGLAKSNPFQAQAALRSGKFDEYLDPRQKASLEDHISSVIEQKATQSEKLLNLKDKDPWEFAKKIGATGGVKPVSMGEDAAQSFLERHEFITKFNAKHGTKMPFLSDDESDRVVNAFMQMNPNDAVKVMANVDSQVKDDIKAQFARDVFKKEPSIGVAMMMAADSPQDAKNILNGMNLLRSGGDGKGRGIKAPSSSEVERQFDEYVGTSLEDGGARQMFRQTINAHMVGSLMKENETDFENFSSKDFRKSAEAVLGPKVEIGGAQTFSFRKNNGEFLGEDELSDLVDSLSDDKVLAALGDVPRTVSGEPINLKKSRGRLSLKIVGDGRYYVVRDNAEHAYDKDGKPYVLDLKTYLKKSKSLKPTKAGGLVNDNRGYGMGL